MTAKLRAYPEYKSSGIDWLGQIPCHWALSKYKYHATNRMGETILREQMQDTGIPIYSATQDDSILGYIEQANLILKKGDFVIPARGNSIGYVSVVKQDVATCTQTTICSSNFSNIIQDYLYYCCIAFKDIWFEFDNTAIPQITVNQVNNNTLPIPTIAEQELIARYLDEVCGQIDALVTEKQAQVDELRVYHIALITETVTRGLNPDAPLRPSGIDWLGDIPEHWSLSKLKYYVDINSGEAISREKISNSDQFPVYGGGDKIGFTNESNVDSKTIIIGRVGARCGCVTLLKEPAWATDNSLTCITTQHPNYIARLLEAANLNRLNESNAQPLITSTKVKNLEVAMPPLAEQQQISEYLDAKTAKIDEAIGELEAQLKDLADYKQAVITEAVTGKVDVRDWKPKD